MESFDVDLGPLSVVCKYSSINKHSSLCEWKETSTCRRWSRQWDLSSFGREWNHFAHIRCSLHRKRLAYLQWHVSLFWNLILLSYTLVKTKVAHCCTHWRLYSEQHWLVVCLRTRFLIFSIYYHFEISFRSQSIYLCLHLDMRTADGLGIGMTLRGIPNVPISTRTSKLLISYQQCLQGRRKLTAAHKCSVTLSVNFLFRSTLAGLCVNYCSRLWYWLHFLHTSMQDKAEWMNFLMSFSVVSASIWILSPWCK